jgi:hypothetical protein
VLAFNSYAGSSQYRRRDPRTPDDGQTWRGRDKTFCRSATGVRTQNHNHQSYVGGVCIVVGNSAWPALQRLLELELRRSVINSHTGRVGIIFEIRARLMFSRLGIAISARCSTAL